VFIQASVPNASALARLVIDPAILVGAGDIASCTSAGDEATAALLDQIPGSVFTAGDNAYPSGGAQAFADCFDPTWGRNKLRIRPAPGNHEYETPAASGYFGYFGAAAGDPATGFYSYDYGAWHVVVINSSISVSATSPQVQWLRRDLATHTQLCTITYFHYSLFSSGLYNMPAMKPVWDALYQAGVDVVVSAHDHFYERFAPQTPAGTPDPTHGIREFVVGTGGHSHHAFTSVAPNSEIRNNQTFGVLKLTLHPTGYDWQFVPVAGARFTDSGTAACH